MNKFNYKILLFALFSMSFFCSDSTAQNDPLRVNAEQKQTIKRLNRPNLLSELELKPEQIRQVRRINADKKPLLRDAQIKFREANRQLDQAIYADNVDEAEIQTRLKDVQTAQAEIQKMRALIEFEVRKVLTPEQLVKFREIRRQFAPENDNFPNRRKKPQSEMLNQKNFNRQRRPRANF